MGNRWTAPTSLTLSFVRLRRWQPACLRSSLFRAAATLEAGDLIINNALGELRCFNCIPPELTEAPPPEGADHPFVRVSVQSDVPFTDLV